MEDAQQEVHGRGRAAVPAVLRVAQPRHAEPRRAVLRLGGGGGRRRAGQGSPSAAEAAPLPRHGRRRRRHLGPPPFGASSSLCPGPKGTSSLCPSPSLTDNDRQSLLGLVGEAPRTPLGAGWAGSMVIVSLRLLAAHFVPQLTNIALLFLNRVATGSPCQAQPH